MDQKTHCILCEIWEQSSEELHRIVDEYVASIPQEQKASPDCYEQRLTICRDCSHMHGGMCGVCGCFVQARAVKAAQHCPKPYQYW